MLTIEAHAVRLPKWPLIPIKSDPSHPVNNGLYRLVRRSALVRILNAKNECSLFPPREQLIEQRGPHSADVEVAGRTWGKSDSDLAHRCLLVLDGRGEDGTGTAEEDAGTSHGITLSALPWQDFY